MKGLLMKDYCLLFRQKQFFFGILFLAVVYTFMLHTPTLAVPFAVMMVSSFTISTIAYDDYENGSAFLFTLPITREDYINEKYLFGLINTLVTGSVLITLEYVISLVSGNVIPVSELYMMMFSAFMVSAFMLSICIPPQLKFGAEKSRMATLGVMMACILIACGISWIAKQLGMDMASIEAWIDRQNTMAEGILIIAGCALALLISRTISLKILKRKEF